MKHLIFLVVTLVLFSCGHKGDKNDPLYKDVMAIHDEVMPKMGTMHKLKKKLRKLPKSSDKTTLDLIQKLDQADEAMMVWMADFDPPEDGPERKAYLTAELESVKEMAAKINNSISDAEAFLNTNK